MLGESAPILEYAGPHGDQPASSRMVREEMDGGGVRLVDLPVGWRGLRGDVVLCVMGVVFAGAFGIALVAALVAGEWRAALFLLAPFTAAAALSPVLWIETRRRARVPLVIEASAAEGLRIKRPALIRPRVEWPAERVSEVRAGAAVPTFRGRMVSTLYVVPRRGLTISLMENRDAREVRWAARELRRALGLAEREG